jgi:hypothetical protein
MSARKATRRRKAPPIPERQPDRKHMFWLNNPRLPILGSARPKACPFCGAPDEIYVHIDKVETPKGRRHNNAYVYCHGCGAQGTLTSDGIFDGGPEATETTLHDMVVQAAELWNGRKKPWRGRS